MENAVASVVSIAVALTGMLVLLQGSLSSADRVSAAWQVMGNKTAEIASTRISKVGVGQILTTDGKNKVRITLWNEGPTATARFADWDVIVQYYTKREEGGKGKEEEEGGKGKEEEGEGGRQGEYVTRWLPYVEDHPSDNEWTVKGIYRDAQARSPEVVGPGILDPGEEMILELKVKPDIKKNTINWVTIAPSNAIPLSVYFRRTGGH
jgi:flagellar protein FlaF